MLKIILYFYTGVLFLNAAFSALLWLDNRHSLYKYTFFLWVCTFINFFLQGLFDKGDFATILSFSTYFVVSVLFSKILSSANKLKFYIIPYSVIMFIGLMASLLFHLKGLGFTIISLPTAIGVAIPMLHTAYLSIKNYQGEDNFNNIIYSTFLTLNGLHFLDYPFLRMDKDFAIFGFSIALIFLTSFSIFLPAFISKNISLRDKNKLKEKVNKSEETERLLSEHKRELQQNQLILKDFLEIVGHEIKTPLNGIFGALDLTDKSELSNDLKDNFNIIQSSSCQLLGLSQNLLDFVSLKNKDFKLNNITFDIKSLIEDVRLDAKRCLQDETFKINYDNTKVSNIYTDNLRLKNIFINLIKIMFKYSEKKEVTIEVDQEDWKENKSIFNFKIIDESYGYSPSENEYIQNSLNIDLINNHIAINTIDLGLMIASQTISKLNGQIEFHNSEEGAAFIFKLPLQVHNIPPVVSTLSKLQDIHKVCSTKKYNILVAEDSEINQRVMQKLLEKNGHDCVVTSDGLKAIKELQNRNYDFVILDLQMPIMDGFEAIEFIRHKSNEKIKDIPIITLSAMDHAIGSKKSLELGANAHLSKPVKSEELFELLSTISQDLD